MTVRIFQPLAETVRVNYPAAKDQGNDDLDHESSRVWVGTLPVKDVPDYRVEVDYGQGATTRVDPYRFLPTLSEMDLHLINEGRHEQLWMVLGAHRRVYDGFGDRVDGTSFAVWAPSAKGVRLKGDFNARDGREHPDAPARVLGRLGAVRARRRLGDEVQVPDPRRRRPVAREADPMALRTENPPATSSVSSRPPTPGPTTTG